MRLLSPAICLPVVVHAALDLLLIEQVLLKCQKQLHGWRLEDQSHTSTL